MTMNKRAGAIIIKDHQILLIHRYQEGWGEYWVFPGGGVQEGESIEDAMKREVAEELSLTVTECKPLFEVFNPFTMGGHFPPRQEYYFLVSDYTGQVKLGGEEAASMNEKQQFYPTWVGLDKIKHMETLRPEEVREKLIETLGI